MRRYLMILLCAALLLAPIHGMAESKSAKAYLITPAGSTAALWEERSDERFSVAGLCKLPAILTLCRAFDAGLIDPDAEMDVSKKASKVSGPSAYLEAGERIAAGELIKAAVMISAGDAIVALGENAFGSEEMFLQNIGVILAEAKVDVSLASCLGTGTAFSCAELLRLAALALDSKTFRTYCGVYMDSISHAKGTTTELVTANRMIRSYAGCFGLLTGSSREDGYCGIFAAERNGMTYLCAVLGSPTGDARFAEATHLFDDAFANYRLDTPATKGTPLLSDYPVLYGDRKTVHLLPDETVVLLRNKADGALQTSFDLPESLLAPLHPEEPVGTATFTDEAGNTLAVVSLYPAEAVVSNGFPDVLRWLLTQYLLH